MLDWQTLIVGFCVLLAAAWLGWRIVRTVRGRAATGCGTACDSCGHRSEPAGGAKSDGFVSVDQLVHSSPRKD